MRPWRSELAGRIDTTELSSTALEGNPLGDPTTRPLWVYLPPGYDDGSQRYPTVYLLQGFGGYVNRWETRPAMFAKTVPERIDEVLASGTVPPCLVVFVDAWTSLGGSQFVDSPGTGRYHTYLCEDVVEFVDTHYRTLPEAHHRALQGKSSGGYGAMVNTMWRPDVFGAFASHAGDARFEECYLPDFRDAYRALRDRYHGSYEEFYADLERREPMSRSDDHALVNIFAMAACYSTDPDGTVQLPFETETGRLRPEIWARWLAFDPVALVQTHYAALTSLAGIWVDAGRADNFGLDLGAEAFCDEMRRAGIGDFHFELFDGTHSGIDHRYPVGLAYLADRIAADTTR